MNPILGVLIVLTNTIVCFRNFNAGLFFYIIGAFTFPNIHLGNYIVSYEISAFIPIFVLFLRNYRMKKVQISKIHVLLYIYFILLIGASLISINLYNTSISWLSILGTFRHFLLFFMIFQVMRVSKDYLEKILLTVICINMILVIIQIIFPQSVLMFYNFYFKESLVPLKYILKIGRFARTTGSFGTPVNLGIFSLISFTFFYTKVLKLDLRKEVIIGLICSILCGISSLTKSFILGMPIIIIISTTIVIVLFPLRSKIKIDLKKMVILVVIVMLVAIMAVGFIQVVTKQGFFVSYYFGYLLKPLEALESRYNLDEGILSLTIEVIKNNFLIGVGMTRPLGEFIGDSGYIILLHNTGLLGGILFVFIIGMIIYKSFIERNLTALMMVFALLLSGLATPCFFSLVGIIIISYADSISSKITSKDINLFNVVKRRGNDFVAEEN